MPSMGMYTEEGVLAAWLRPAGTRVAMGDPVAEITTEKATFEIPAPEEGTLHPVAAIGAILKVEALMGYILQQGETLREGADLKPVEVADKRFSATLPSAAAKSTAAARPLRASPIAKRMAEQHGIDLPEVKGTGPGGRIVEADIQAAIAERSLAGQSIIADQLISERIPMAGLRRSLAEHLRNSLATAA